MKVYCKGCGNEIYDMDETIITTSYLKMFKLKSDRCPFCERLLDEAFSIKWRDNKHES